MADELEDFTIAEGAWKDWSPAPVRFSDELPPFPSEALPKWLGDQAIATAGRLQCPTDLPGVLVLGILAAACGGFVTVEPEYEWVEGTNLYLAVCLPPGAGKSPVFKTMTAPLYAYQEEVQGAAVGEIAKIETERLSAEAKLRKADAQSSTEPDDQKLKDAATEARKKLREIRVPMQPRFLVDDCTPERLVTLLSQNDGILALASDEGGVFQQIAGRYTGMPNLDVYLKAFSNSSLVVDRADGRTEQIKRPSLTIVLAVQPAVMRAAAANPVMVDRGLIDRFLLASPRDIQVEGSHVEGRRVSREKETKAIGAAFNETFMKLIRAVRKDKVVLTISEEALEPYDQWRIALTARKAGDLAALLGFVSKLEGAMVMRMAALLHIAEAFATKGKVSKWATTPISAETMSKSIEFADYFLLHALISHSDLALSPLHAKAARVLDWLAKSWMRPIVTKRDIQYGLRGVFPTAKSVDSAVDVLVQGNWLRVVEPPAGKSSGRPGSPKFVVHQSLI